MRLHMIGGAAEVGASCLVVEAAGRRVLVDCGVRPGAPDPLPDLRALQELGGLDAVVVTHAHADHIGALPLAAPAFPAAPVVATPATLALMAVMLGDAVRIGEQRAQEGDLPPYGRAAVDALLARVRPLPFGQPCPLLQPAGEPAWQITFFPAGHVLGAAMALLETPEGAVLVSGDVSLTPQRTVGPAVPPRRRVDVLVLESTYGDRMHSPRQGEEERLVTQVREVLGRRGHCLIPAFALGRAQEVLLILAEARRQGHLTAPVWVDGLVRAVCGVYTAHGAAGTARLRKLITRQGNPFVTAEGPVRAVETSEQRRSLLQGPPAVIVSSSGMLLGGPSAFYAAQLAPDERHAILITGYQDEESPGRRLLDLADAAPGDRRLVLAGTEVPVRCAVLRYSLSAHADGDELASLAERLRPHLTLLVHGGAEARTALAGKIAVRGQPCKLPATGETVSLPRRVRHTRPPDTGVVTRADPTMEDLVTLAQSAGPLRGWTALELAERHYGRITAAGVAIVEERLAQDTAFTPDRLRPTVYRLEPNAAPSAPGTPAPQEHVRQRLQDLLGADPTLVKASLYPDQARVEVRFHFPAVAEARYGDDLRTLAEETGWQIGIRPTPDTGALQAAALRHLPEGVQALAPPSLHLEARRVAVQVAGAAGDVELAASAAAYEAETGYGLILHGELSWPPAITGPGPAEAAMPPPDDLPLPGPRVDATTAFATIRAAFAAVRVSLYNVGQKGDYIEVAFITPAVGRRHTALLAQVAAQVGWPVRAAPQPQQGAVIDAVRSIVTRRLARGPGIHAAEERVRVRLALGKQADPAEVEGWQRAVWETTGYALEVQVAPGTPILTPQVPSQL